MQNPDHSGSLEQRLNKGVDGFTQWLLREDTFLKLARARFRDEVITDRATSDFGVRPTLDVNDDGSQIFGLLFSREISTSSGSIEVLDSLKLGKVEGNAVVGITPEFKGLLDIIGVNANTGTQAVFSAWTQAYKILQSEVSAPLSINPITHTPDVRLRFEATNLPYFVL